MSDSAVRGVVDASIEAEEAELRSSRAEVARLSLQLRTLAHEVVAEQRADAELDRRLADAEAVLRVALRERIAARVEQLAGDLDEARAAGARAVDAARVEAVRIAAQAPRPDATQRRAPVEERAALPASTDLEGLSHLIQVAVVAGVAEVVERLGATARPVAPSEIASPASVDAFEEPTFWERAAHLDVLLPLIAVLIVFVILFAWVG